MRRVKFCQIARTQSGFRGRDQDARDVPRCACFERRNLNWRPEHVGPVGSVVALDLLQVVVLQDRPVHRPAHKALQVADAVIAHPTAHAVAPFQGYSRMRGSLNTARGPEPNLASMPVVSAARIARVNSVWVKVTRAVILARFTEGLASETAVPKTVMIDAAYMKAHRTATSLRQTRRCSRRGSGHRRRYAATAPESPDEVGLIGGGHKARNANAIICRGSFT